MATAQSTAGPTVTGQVVGDLNDPEYICWLKANRALHCTIEVLRHVCSAEMKKFHDSLLQTHRNGPCNAACSHSDIKTDDKRKSWSIHCPDNVCSAWLADIVKGRTKKSTRLTWQNSELSQWLTEPWQLAKIYMDHGQDRKCVNSADTDAAGIVQLLLNCKQFKQVLDIKKVDAVRKVRNLLMHSKGMKVSSDDLTKYIQTMVQLLEDLVKLHQDPEANRAVTEIRQIETTAIQVNHTELLVQERMIWKDLIACQADDKKQEILALVSSNTRLQEVINDIEKWQDEVEAQMKDLQDADKHKTVQMSEYNGRISRLEKDKASQRKDNLNKWRSQFKDAQRRELQYYVEKKNEDDNTTFQNLTNMFVTLRMHNCNNYVKLETRKDHVNLQPHMDEMDINAHTEIQVRDLFEAEQPLMNQPVRTLVIGKAGIGKSMLCRHIVDQWLQNELLPDDIDHIFLFQLSDLSHINICSLEDLFFKHHIGGMASREVIDEFFQQILAEPHKTLVIFDSLEEIGVLPLEKQKFYRSERVEMPRLIASIINGYTIPSIRVLVTSRPGDGLNYDRYNKRVEIYGITPETIYDYINKFSGDDDNLQKSITADIDQNVNIFSFCYIPQVLNMICCIERMQHRNNPQLPETLTELYVSVVTNFLHSQYPKHKDAELKEYILNHAKMAKCGMKQVPIKVKFSKEDIHDFHLEEMAVKCGLVSESRKSGITATPVYCFHHLTVEEFLAAVALVTNIKRVKRMMKKASDRQLDLMVIFIAGLLGNSKNHPFLRSLQWKSVHRLIQWNFARSLKKLIKLVVARERRKEAGTEAEHKCAAHKASTLLLVMMIYESRKAKLCHHASGYILKDGKELDLEDQQVSPADLHALVYVLPEMGITSLNLQKCGLAGKEATNLLDVLGSLPQLTQLWLFGNDDLHGPAMTTALGHSLEKLTKLEKLDLGRCHLNDEDVKKLSGALSRLEQLRTLMLNQNYITDAGALSVTNDTVKLPSITKLWLHCNLLTEVGVENVRQAASAAPHMWLVGLDMQRMEGQGATHSDPVKFCKNTLDQVKAALTRLNERPVKERHSHWEEETKGMKLWQKKAEDKLLEAEERNTVSNIGERRMHEQQSGSNGSPLDVQHP